MRKLIKFTLPAIYSISLLLSACQKESVETVATKGDYFPTSTGSEWLYLVTSAYETSSRAPINNITGDTIIGNITYSVLSTLTKVSDNLTDTGIMFVRKENGNYYAKHPVYVGSTDRGEYIFLKDNVRQGSKWLHKISDNFEIEYTVSAIDQQRKIEGIVYDAVIEITENEYHMEDGEKVLIFTTRSVYAKGIGLVQRESEAFVYTSFITHTLKRFDIK